MTRAQSLLAELNPTSGGAMAGPQIRVATSRIRAALDKAAQAAEQLAAAAEQSAGRFDETLGQAHAVVRDMAEAEVEMREAFGLNVGNEDTPPTSPTSPPGKLPDAPQLPGGGSAQSTEITALGPVNRVKP